MNPSSSSLFWLRLLSSFFVMVERWIPSLAGVETREVLQLRYPWYLRTELYRVVSISLL